MLTNEQLIASLERDGALRSEKIKNALLEFPREKFVPDDLRQSAYDDRPLPIGEGQTISQPFTVLFMLHLLGAQAGDNVLEIGAGSGWQTAILSYLVGDKGHIWAYEINKKVGEFGKKNLEKFNLKNIDYIVDDVRRHFKERAPYNKIIAGAAFDKIPDDLKILLSIGGRLVAPTQNNDVRSIERMNENDFRETVYPGFMFVPVI